MEISNFIGNFLHRARFLLFILCLIVAWPCLIKCRQKSSLTFRHFLENIALPLRTVSLTSRLEITNEAFCSSCRNLFLSLFVFLLEDRRKLGELRIYVGRSRWSSFALVCALYPSSSPTYISLSLFVFFVKPPPWLFRYSFCTRIDEPISALGNEFSEIAGRYVEFRVAGISAE